MKAKFKGASGSMGLTHGKGYRSKVEIADYKGKPHIWLRVWVGMNFVDIPYVSLEKLLENWEVKS
jgi:hypothetical protein